MGNITSFDKNSFKSAEYLYSKIKRDFKSYGSANLIDDADFPLYTAEILKKLGVSVYKEENAVLRVKNGKASLPKDFMEIYAAYKCGDCVQETGGNILQSKNVINYRTYYDILDKTNCTLSCSCNKDIIQTVTIRQYINDCNIDYNYQHLHLLKLSPTTSKFCSEHTLNNRHNNHFKDEISINNRCIFTNFNDGDIFLQYFAFPTDENGLPMIPDVIEVEKAIEWHIKCELLTNFWLVGDVPDIQNKWQYAEAEAAKWMAESRYINKLPAFATLVESARRGRRINKMAFFAQQDTNYNRF